MNTYQILHQTLLSPLNPEQKEALRNLPELEPYGFTAEQMQNWEGHFSRFCTEALITLVQQRHKTPQAAIAEINQLSGIQVWGVSKGLTREDVLDFDMAEIDTLLLLKDKLTASQLRTWKGGVFYSSHKDALENLMVKRGMNARDAIAEINKIDSAQAAGIAKGLTRVEVLGLQEYQIHALIELRKINPSTELTPSHLRSWEGDYFSHSHKKALIDLINQRHFKPDDAIAEINRFDEFEARMIAERRLSRDEVFGFNGWEVNILRDLKKEGLLPAHLRKRILPDEKDKFDNGFFGGHDAAVRYLIKTKGLKPEAAISEISGLNNWQADRLARGESREKILERGVTFRF